LSGRVFRGESLGKLFDDLPSDSKELKSMRLTSRISHVLVLSPIFVCFPHAVASPLAPCVKAVSSSNGNYLVILESQMEPETKETPGQPSQVRQITLEVYPREKFLNEKDRLDSQATFWTDLTMQWSVILDSRETPSVSSCPYFLITDDGEFMVVFEGPWVSADTGMRIYRRRDHRGDPVREGPDHGVFIRDVPLKEMWPADKLASLVTWTDFTPQWFSGGNFEFTRDCGQLIYKTHWGSTVHIHLADGTVSTN
jgi:hypothetical protein